MFHWLCVKELVRAQLMFLEVKFDPVNLFCFCLLNFSFSRSTRSLLCLLFGSYLFSTWLPSISWLFQTPDKAFFALPSPYPFVSKALTWKRSRIFQICTLTSQDDTIWGERPRGKKLCWQNMHGVAMNTSIAVQQRNRQSDALGRREVVVCDIVCLFS